MRSVRPACKIRDVELCGLKKAKRLKIFSRRFRRFSRRDALSTQIVARLISPQSLVPRPFF
jgi:hypothetical protein